MTCSNCSLLDPFHLEGYLTLFVYLLPNIILYIIFSPKCSSQPSYRPNQAQAGNRGREVRNADTNYISHSNLSEIPVLAGSTLRVNLSGFQICKFVQYTCSWFMTSTPTSLPQGKSMAIDHTPLNPPHLPPILVMDFLSMFFIVPMNQLSLKLDISQETTMHLKPILNRTISVLYLVYPQNIVI